MSAFPTPLGMFDAPTSLPVPLSPSAPMAIDGATPERVPGGLPPVPSTHRGDFYPPQPSSRPVPTSSMSGANTTSQLLANTSAAVAHYDPFVAQSALYNMRQNTPASSGLDFVDYNLPQPRPTQSSGALVAFQDPSPAFNVSPSKEQVKARAQALEEANRQLQQQVVNTQQEAFNQRCQDMQDFQGAATNFKEEYHRKAQLLSIAAKDAVDVAVATTEAKAKAEIASVQQSLKQVQAHANDKLQQAHSQVQTLQATAQHDLDLQSRQHAERIQNL